jgi:acetylornithine/succinyldiaminopimelate/putrescine aminotransferase
MPIGAFIASFEHMALLKEHPKLGHITTFGGHPVIAAAALATLRVLMRDQLMEDTGRKESLFRKHLQHKQIKEIRGKGLMLAIMLDDSEKVNFVIKKAIERGVLLFWLLFEPRAIRITPPLTISDQEIIQGCKTILEILDEL